MNCNGRAGQSCARRVGVRASRWRARSHAPYQFIVLSPVKNTRASLAECEGQKGILLSTKQWRSNNQTDLYVS